MKNASSQRKKPLVIEVALILAGVAMVVYGAWNMTAEVSFASVLRRAQIHFSNQEYDFALGVLTKHRPRNLKEKVALGEAICQAYLAAEKYREAQVAAAELMKVSPDNPVANWTMGRSLLFEGRFASAAPFLEAAVKKSPTKIELRLDLARAHLFSERADLAWVVLNDALEIDPNNITAHRLLGQAYMKLGKTAEAKKELEWGR